MVSRKCHGWRERDRVHRVGTRNGYRTKGIAGLVYGVRDG